MKGRLGQIPPSLSQNGTNDPSSLHNNQLTTQHWHKNNNIAENWDQTLLTENRNDLIVLDDLKAASDYEAERVYTLPSVVQKIARSRVTHGEVHSQRSQTTVARQPERRVLIEHLAIQVDANVCLHVFGTVVEHLVETNGVNYLLEDFYVRTHIV